MYIDRKELIQEEKLRNLIRKSIKTINRKKELREKQEVGDKQTLRSYIIKLVEAEKNLIAPHPSTGINVLEDLLKKIIPQIETEYKKLTTSHEQRTSFQTHIVNALQNSLAPTRASEKAGTPEEEEKAIDVDLYEAEDIAMDVGGDVENEVESEATEDDDFIDIDGSSSPAPADEKSDAFGLEGEDETGRNMAFKAFERIETSVVDAYAILSNDEDRELFYDYLLTNMKLYFDKFEDELTSLLPEPTTDEYEAEKDQQDFTGEEGEDELGGEFEDELGGELGGEDQLPM